MRPYAVLPYTVKNASQYEQTCHNALPGKGHIDLFYRLLMCSFAFVILCAAGCSNVFDAEPVVPGAPVESLPIVGFCQLGEESEWRVANTQSIMDAAQSAGIQLMYENAQQKLENQIKAIRSFIAYKVDAIVLSPIVETGWDAVLSEAAEAGIPVILEDRNLTDAPDGAVVAWIGSDFYAEGRKAAAEVLSAFKNEEGTVNIVELRGTYGSTAAEKRAEGFRDTIGERTRYNIIRSASGDFTLAKGREAMREIIDQIGADQIDVIFSHNDDMAIGAIEALEESGLVPGRDVFIVTVDAQEKARQLVAEGKINVAVECNPDIGPQVLEVVQDVLSGAEVPSVTYSKEGVVTKESLAEASSTASAKGS